MAKILGSAIVCQNDKFTVRVVSTEFGNVESTAVDHIVLMALEMFQKRPDLKPHLFITVVAAESFGDGFALYHSGMQHVAISGLYPEGIEGLDKEHWLDELRVCVAHELLHYEQELLGTLESSEENEELTEKLAYELAGVQRPLAHPTSPTQD